MSFISIIMIKEDRQTTGYWEVHYKQDKAAINSIDKRKRTLILGLTLYRRQNHLKCSVNYLSKQVQSKRRQTEIFLMAAAPVIVSRTNRWKIKWWQLASMRIQHTQEQKERINELPIPTKENQLLPLPLLPPSTCAPSNTRTSQ